MYMHNIHVLMGNGNGNPALFPHNSSQWAVFPVFFPRFDTRGICVPHDYAICTLYTPRSGQLNTQNPKFVAIYGQFNSTKPNCFKRKLMVPCKYYGVFKNRLPKKTHGLKMVESKCSFNTLDGSKFPAPVGRFLIPKIILTTITVIPYYPFIVD